MKSPTKDPTLRKALRVHVPVALGVVTGLSLESCYGGWSEWLLFKMAAGIGGFVFWWLIITVGYHAYYFGKSLLHHPR